jgi:hypothetical protein
MFNKQTTPHPSPLPRGERDGVRGLEFRSSEFWDYLIIGAWNLEIHSF